MVRMYIAMYKWQVVFKEVPDHVYTGSSGHVFVSLVLIVVSCHLFTPVVGQPSWDHSLCVWHCHHIPAVSQCKYGQVGFAAHNYVQCISTYCIQYILRMHIYSVA